jgi:DNA-binding winged helix-turn-helix (wHTH) protein
VGDWVVDTRLDEITRPGETVKLERRMTQVLAMLAARPGDLVTIDELLDTVWSGVVVTQGSVYKAIAQLRKHLGDLSDEPSYITTIPRRGYRLIAPVTRNVSLSGAAAGVAPLAISGWPPDLPSTFDGMEIIRLLGEGTMGQVFLAREIALERLVALKVLKPEFATEPVVRARFQREALAAARIVHPNVAALFRAGELPNGAQYLAGEFIEGHTLAELLAIEGRLSVARGRRILAAVADALAAAHSKRIIHRDLKPGNVLIERGTDRVVLADFGVAALQESGRMPEGRLTRAGEQFGDPRYRSPEQILGVSLTSASDIYSLGILAYQLLAGRSPYEPSTAQELAQAHISAAPLELQALRQEVPAEVAAAVARCLAKRPEDRPTADELARLLRSSDAPAEDARPVEPGSSSWRRAIVVIAAAALAAVLGAAIYWRFAVE